MLNNKQIIEIAMSQSAIDIGCKPEDFLKTEAVIADGIIGEGARVYYKEPLSCNFVSYGNNVVASVKPEIREEVTEFVGRYEFYHLFETPNALWLNERLASKGHKLCYMAYYYLPDVEKLKPLSCSYQTRLMEKGEFTHLYGKCWGNAILDIRKEYDVLALGAYDGEKLVGLAGCSADCEQMWQIGIDVLPEYRRQGIAAALTSNLALEILKRDKVPFYCCAWSNIPSAKNASRSGFTPAWVELTVKPSDFVDKQNYR